MHLELTSSKWVHVSYMLEVILKSNPAICYGVLCVKRLVTPYVPLSELLHYHMSIVKFSAHSQHYQTPKACEIDDLVNKCHFCNVQLKIGYF